MPRFTVTSPDGKTYKGTAPDGATEADIYEYVQKQVMASTPVPFTDQMLGEKTPMPKEQYEQAMRESNPGVRLIRGLGMSGTPKSEASKRTGMGIRYGDENASDTLGTAGDIVTSGLLGVGVGQIAKPVTAVQRMLTNTGAGGLVAGVHPGATPGDVGMGMAMGGLPTAAFEGFRGAKDWAGRNFSAPGFVKHWYEQNIGKKWLPEAKRLLGSTDDAIEQTTHGQVRYPATAAEKVAGSPAGSVIQSQQDVIRHTPGGISSDFAQRTLDQKQALADAVLSRKAATDTLRTKALDLANQGGVQADDVLQGIRNIRNVPELGASDVVDKTLVHLEKKLATLADANGNIDAKALYTIRKELGNTIKGFSKETQNWDKKLTAMIEGDIQKGMDWAINNGIRRANPALPSSAKTPWNHYLDEYASRSQAIGDTIATMKTKYKPIEKANIPGATNQGPEQVKHILPNWLNTKVTGTRWLVERIADRMEPKIDAIQSDIMRHPEKFAAMLDDVPMRYRPVINALITANQSAAAGQLVPERRKEVASVR